MKGRGINPAHEHDGPQPYFDDDVPRNVTAVASQMAFLRCRVHDLGHKSVSAVRAIASVFLEDKTFVQSPIVHRFFSKLKWAVSL